MSESTISVGTGDYVVCTNGIEGIVDEILENGWVNIKLIPYRAQWKKIHKSQIIEVRR